MKHKKWQYMSQITSSAVMSLQNEFQGGWLCIPGYLTKEANEQVNEIKSGKLSTADQEFQWVECIDQVIRQTEAENTTRIQGHVALTRDTRMEPESAYQFAGSMLIDSGCSFTIVGYSFFEEMCLSSDGEHASTMYSLIENQKKRTFQMHQEWKNCWNTLETQA